MAELYYNKSYLSKLKYIKVLFTSKEGRKHEITTDIKSIDDNIISLYFRDNRGLKINYPQQIVIKFICEDALWEILEKISKY